MFGTSRLVRAATWAGAMLLVAAGTSWGQDAAPAPAPGPATTAAAPAPEAAQTEGKDVQALWNEMIYYIKVAKPDLALSYGKEILTKPDAAETLFLIAGNRPNDVAELTRGARDKDLKPVVEQIQALIEKGYAKDRSNQKRIEDAIDLLGGSSTGYQIAVKRLLESGEYAMPNLIRRLRSPQSSNSLKDRILTILPRFGLAAIRPVSEALQCKDPLVVANLASVLGQIGYPHAAPMLREVLDRPEFQLDPKQSSPPESVAAVRKAAQTALITCAGKESLQKSAPQLYYNLADQYYRGVESIQSPPNLDVANVWYWADDVGLSYREVPRAIFMDVYAMRYSRLALKHDSGLSEAVSLWLAAGLRKEADLPAGAEDPTLVEGEPPAKFYALAAGAQYLQEVLARALADKNVAVATGAIDALARTAGAKSLVAPASGGTQPLVDAMSFSDARIRFFAAVTLASALPEERFVGWEKVLPTLTDAMRMTTGKRAVLVGAASDLTNKVKGLVRAAGWDVLDAAAADRGVAAATAAGGADLVCIVATDDATAAVRQFRREPLTAKAAIVVVGKEQPPELARTDKQVTVLPAGAADEAINAALGGAAKTNAGGLTEEQSGQWALRAAEVVRLLGLTNNRVFEIQRALDPLIGLLNDKRAEIRLAAASALAAMPTGPAQQAIARLALTADVEEKVRVSAMNIACESVRKFGNLLGADQSAAILDLAAGKASAELKDAAAQLSGALSLSSEKVKSLILEAGK